jgi:hypothetical protein
VVRELCPESLSNHDREEGSPRVFAAMAVTGGKGEGTGVVRSRWWWFGMAEDDEWVEGMGEVQSLVSDGKLYGPVGVLGED